MREDFSGDSRRRPLVLLLAAGSAMRFGSDKRSTLMASRKTLLQQSISQYRDIGFQVCVCLSISAEDDEIARGLLRESVGFLRCVRSQEGMGGTLAEAAANIKDESGVLVALADMPGLMSQTILRVAQSMHSKCIVYPVYQGRRGHPVFFGQKFFPDLQLLSGDAGARQLIEKNAESCIPVPVTDPGVVMDVDTPEDLQQMEQLLRRRYSDGESG